MALNPEWKRIARKAWSFRLMGLAGMFTTVEAVLPLFMDKFPRGVFALLTLVFVTGGMIARVIAQRGFDD